MYGVITFWKFYSFLLLDRSNKTSWVFPTLKSTSRFLPQSTVSRRSDSSSEANSSCCHRSDAWSDIEGFRKLRCLCNVFTISMTYDGDFCKVGPSKLICETNWWTAPCVMRFLLEDRSEQTMILRLCGSGKYTTVLCFDIRGGDARVP